MYTSFKLLSHVFDDANKDDQLLTDHLNGVTEIALMTAKDKGIKDNTVLNVIKTIGMCHDFGKGSTYFQDYIKGKKSSKLKQHGEISAYFTYYMLPEEWKLIGYMCVKRHHGNIDRGDGAFFTCEDKEAMKAIAESLKENKSELEAIYNINLDDFFNKIADESIFYDVEDACYEKYEDEHSTKDYESEFVWIEYMWSLLLTADKTQLIRGNAYSNMCFFDEKIIKSYVGDLRDKAINKNPDIVNSFIFNVRNNIYDEVINSIDSLDISSERILSINVPTGTGKTLSVYGAAFKLANRVYNEQNIKMNIIYSVPFTSVIDQNFFVLEEVLKSNNINISSDMLLKHHSMTPLNYKDNEEKEFKNYDARFLVENWQSTIITTTFVQLFNTIFKSGINSITQRFNRLAGSIIILDEVQAVPPKYYKIIEDIFRILCEKFNCFIISVTATKPLFLSGSELVEDNEKIFKSLNRINFEVNIDRGITIEEFEDNLESDINNNGDKSFLIILNTVKSTKTVYKYLREKYDGKRKVLYLSTEVLPIIRLEIIKKIKESNEKLILVSTQLVEAGVDIDFDIVYRDIAPIDCINQSAGRANRNGLSKKGIVKLVKLVNDKERLFASSVYASTLIEATENIIKDKHNISESEIFDINNKYYKELARITKGKEQSEYNKYCEYIKNLNFEKIRGFELINKLNNKVDLFVLYDETAKKLFDIIKSDCEYQELANAWRGLNQYRISVNKDLVDDICEKEGQLIKGFMFLDKEYYSYEDGIKISYTMSI